MARKLFIRDEKRKVYMGHFPPKGGWKAGKNGYRRVLCQITDIEALEGHEQQQRLIALYQKVQSELQAEEQSKEEKYKVQQIKFKSITVKEAAKTWLAEVKLLKSDRTVSSYQSTVDYYLRACGDHPVKDLDRYKNIQFYDFLATTPLYRNKVFAKSTQNYHMRQLQVFVSWAHECGMLTKELKLKKMPKPKTDMETFSLEHLKTLKDHINQRLEDEVKAREILNLTNMQRAFNMATNSLLRIGAIDAMRLDWIDLDKRIIRVRDNPDRDFINKKYKHPNKPINQELYDFLKNDLANRSPKEIYFLDNGQGKPWYADRAGPSKFASKMCKECNLPKLKPFHWGMRATMITWLLNNGANIKEVQELADHEDIQTTISYHNSRTVQQENAVNALPKI